MPSKRKKNKRRMRRVQALRRALEEQHVPSPPIKASPGIAVSAPPTSAPKKSSRTAAPAPKKIPPVAPAAKTPKVEPKPAAKERVREAVPAEVDGPVPDDEVLKPSPAEPEAQVHTEVEVETPTLGTEDAENPPVEPSPPEAETELVVPATELVAEVTALAEAPVAPVEAVSAETEIQTVHAAEIRTEAELAHHDGEAEAAARTPAAENSGAKVEAETPAERVGVTEVEAERSISEDVVAPALLENAAEEPVVEELSCVQDPADAERAADESLTETVVVSTAEGVAEMLEPERKTKAAPTEEGEDGGDVGELAGDEAAAAPAESASAAEDVPLQFLENPDVPEVAPEVPSQEAESQIHAVKEVETVLVSDFHHHHHHMEIVATVENPGEQTQSTDEAPAPPAPPAPPAEDVFSDAAIEQTHWDVLPEEPKSDACDALCLSPQLSSESAPLSAAVNILEETSVETALNGHIVPEVSIEG